MLTEALNRILSWIKRYQPSYDTCLEPGLSIAEIEEIVKRLPFQLTPEIYELYQWRNGTIQKDVTPIMNTLVTSIKRLDFVQQKL